MSAKRTVTMRRSSVETAIGELCPPHLCAKRRRGRSGPQEDADQGVAQPFFVAGRCPTSIENQLGVLVGSAQGPNYCQRLLRRDAPAQPAAFLKPFSHAIPTHPAQ